MMQQGMAQQGVSLPGASSQGGRAPWEDPSPASSEKTERMTPEEERRTARDAAALDHPRASPAELDVLALERLRPARKGKAPAPLRRDMTPAELHRRTLEDVARERPNLSEEEVAEEAERRLDPTAAGAPGAAAREKRFAELRRLPPDEQQQKVLSDLLQEFPDRPIEELAALAAKRLDELQRPSAPPPDDLDAVLMRKLVRQYPDKSPTELAVPMRSGTRRDEARFDFCGVGTRAASERARRPRSYAVKVSPNAPPP